MMAFNFKDAYLSYYMSVSEELHENLSLTAFNFTSASHFQA